MAVDPCAILGNIETIDKYVIQQIKPHINRALSCKRYREDLEKKVEELTGKQERLKGLVDEAERKIREINQEVHNWRTLADTRIATDEKVLEEYEEIAKKRCCIGLCPNFKARYQLNKKAQEEATAVVELINEAALYDTVDKISHSSSPVAEKNIDVGDYEAFQSRESIVQQIVDDLTIYDKCKIGVCGMGGIGKTTLAKLVASQVKEKKSFDTVVFCKVTAAHSISIIQQEIIDNCGLEIKEQSQSVRARLLLEDLEKKLKKEERKILFVLDDLWEKLDLKAVGIPSPEQHKGCRILMTSRHGHVLSDAMDCGKDVIRIGFLTEEEAWELFKKKTGNSFDNEVLQSKAKEVAKACARLPVAIITLASALKNKTDLSDWNNALLDLQRPSPSSFCKVQEDDPSIEEDVFKSIYLSYKLLSTEELKSIFLLCSQMASDISIVDMLKYSMGLRLFPKDKVRKVEEAQERIRCLVRQLQASCLLLGTGSAEGIALHDVVRVIAQATGSVDHGVFTRSSEDELRDWPDRDCRRIWLRCKITDLPQQLDYPQLELLHIDGKSSTDLEVPDNIFKGKQQLRVLAFTNFSFLRTLPSSFRLLKKNLRTLCLEGCSLKDEAIIAIGKLENLEVLSLAKSEFRRLPIEIGDLKKLKILDLSDCSELEVVPANVISRLSLLEELCMENSFSGWEKGEGANASLAELKKLSLLTNLQIAIPDAEAMVKDLFSPGLKRYRVIIGSSRWWKRSDETKSKLLKLQLEKTSI